MDVSRPSPEVRAKKLTPASVGPYRVLSTGRGTVVIKKSELVERVNRSRMELAPLPKTWRRTTTPVLPIKTLLKRPLARRGLSDA